MMRSGLLRDAALCAAGLAVLLSLPLVFPQPALRDFLIYVMAYGLLAMSLNMLVGLTGLVSFGHAAYFASGAYIFGLLQFVSTFLIAYIYSKYADKHFDPTADRIRHRLEGTDQ